MPKYIAFLRAINVGGHTVRMDHLRQLFETMSFSNVETFIASGNVIFDSKSKNAKALERKIEDYLQKKLGYAVATFIRSKLELTEIARYKPFKNSELNRDGSVLYIALLADRPSEAAKQKLLSISTEVDAFYVHEREAYWLIRGKFSESEFSGATLEKTLGIRATVRNATTIRKMAEKYPAD